MRVVNNFVIGWNNLAPIFQTVRETPRFHGQRCPCQVCPLGKRALVGSILETVPNPYQRDGEEIKQHIYGKRLLAVFHWLPAPMLNVFLLN